MSVVSSYRFAVSESQNYHNYRVVGGDPNVKITRT
jgi:hypothetical protein